MGFLTVLRKMKQKEKEMRILMLYPLIKIQFLNFKLILCQYI